LRVKLDIAHPHALDLATLKARAEERLAHYIDRYPHIPMREHFRWDGDRVVRGSYRGGDGTVTLGEREVRVELDLPFFARPFRARIEDFVRRELALATAAPAA
jgi:hypothetical protein